MALFTNQVDKALPKLTQFYQLSIPHEWARSTPPQSEELDKLIPENIERGLPLSSVSPLFNTELDAWLIRCIPEEHKDSHKLRKGNVSYYSQMAIDYFPLPTTRFISRFNIEQTKTVIFALEQFAELHYKLTHDMKAVYNLPESEALAQSKHKQAINLNNIKPPIDFDRINRHMAHAGLGLSLGYDVASGIEVSVNRPKLLELSLLRDFVDAAVKRRGDTGSFDCCPECNGVFVKTKVKHSYCSHRCRDRVRHREKRRETTK